MNRRARIDVPSDQEWETGLHAAAGNGDVEMVRLLLELGADPTLKDCRFDGDAARSGQSTSQATSRAALLG